MQSHTSSLANDYATGSFQARARARDPSQGCAAAGHPCVTHSCAIRDAASKVSCPDSQPIWVTSSCTCLQVGHNALGSGQVVEQGAKLVDASLETGHFFEYDGWKNIEPAVKDHTLHFIGLLSDGGVHSRYDQLLQMLQGVGPHNDHSSMSCCPQPCPSRFVVSLNISSSNITGGSVLLACLACVVCRGAAARRLHELAWLLVGSASLYSCYDSHPLCLPDSPPDAG